MAIGKASISNIPPEVLSKILDFLHDDPEALYSASLVAREWVHTPRQHLFRRTVLKEFRTPYRGTTQENVPTFLEIAQSEHCTILDAVQCIVIYVTSSQLIKDIVNVFVPSRTLCQIVFMYLNPSTAISWIAQALPNIQDFTFNTWSTLNEDACQLITSFAHLHTLAVYTNAHTIVILPPIDTITRFPFQIIRTLRLRLVDSEDLFEWLEKLEGLCSALEILDLRIFRACHRGWGEVKALNSFLESHSGTLKHLSLGIDYNPSLSEDSSAKQSRIDLSPLVNLRSLSFRTHDMDAVCQSLASSSSLTTLECLAVNALLPWGPDRYSPIKQCDCAVQELLARILSILEGRQSMTTKTFNLYIPNGWRQELNDTVAEPWIRRQQSCALTVSEVIDDDDPQPNTLESIQPLIFKTRQ